MKVLDPVSMQEMQKVLMSFVKAKSSGLEIWLVEFFLEFFDLMGRKMLDVDKESSHKGFFKGDLNATFLTKTFRRLSLPD